MPVDKAFEWFFGWSRSLFRCSFLVSRCVPPNSGHFTRNEKPETRNEPEIGSRRTARGTGRSSSLLPGDRGFARRLRQACPAEARVGCFISPPSLALGELQRGSLRVRSRAEAGGGRGIRTPGTLSGTTVFKYYPRRRRERGFSTKFRNGNGFSDQRKLREVGLNTTTVPVVGTVRGQPNGASSRIRERQ